MSAKEAVRVIFDDYQESIMAEDVNRWIDLWTEDGVQMPPGGPMNVGKPMIQESITQFLNEFGSSDFVIMIDEVQEIGDWAYARGPYSVTWIPKDDRPLEYFKGKYLTIFQRQADKSWKIHRDCFNAREP
jgi:uncharacterized protein (TIGR02246 family)